MEGAWQYSAWETAQCARPDSKLLLLSRCCSTHGTEGRQLPARSGEGGFNERRVRESKGVKKKKKNQATTGTHRELVLLDEIKSRKL